MNLERHGEVAFFTSEARERLRIYDCAYGPPLARPHRRRVMPLEDIRAKHRHFVPAVGMARVYRFVKGESRALTPGVLATQLRGSGFVARTVANMAATKPT
jgi:hypothetical protein